MRTKHNTLNIPDMGCIVPNMGMKRSSDDPTARPDIGLADALFTKVQQRVLGVLFGNPGKTFYGNQLIALARCGTGAVQRELGRLAAAKLVTVTKVGNQKLYQANAAAPVFEELRGLVLKTSGLADILRVALEPVAAQISSAFVYGSVAKGQDTAASDIDLMVVSESLTYADLFAAVEEAVKQLGRPVNPTVYSQQELSKRVSERNAFITRVLGQPRLWLIGDEHDLAA
ncbi:MAG: nucleotidyltransferase domain-containing protein [Candidatus Methylomirabilia bacterium]